MTGVALITFAIPFHRGLPWLREAIESVLAQDEPGWCCVVLDDRGEPSAEVERLVRSFAEPRLGHVMNPSTLGMAGNWNRGLDGATTDLVTLLHADDRLLPSYARVMLDLAARYPRAAGVCCNAQIIDAVGAPRFSFPDRFKRFLVPAGEPWALQGEAGLRALLRGDFVMCPTLCWRRSVLGPRRFEASWNQVQDLEFLTRLLLDGEAIVGTRATAYAYRRHAASATAQQTETLIRFEEESAIYDRLAAQSAARGWRGAARTARRKAILRLHLGFRIATDLAAGHPGRAIQKLRFLLRSDRQRDAGVTR
jgi:GT2 family glycosyltransferase